MEHYLSGRKIVAVILTVCMVLGFAACGSKDDSSSGGNNAYQEYVIGIMDANYLGKYEKYMEITGAAEADAVKIYEANVQDFAFEIESAFSIRQDMVSIALTERYIDLAEQIYGQTKYQAVDVIRDGDIYTISLEIEPVDFYKVMETPFKNAVDAFNERAKNGEFDKFTESEYEEAYGAAIAEALEAASGTISYGDKITVDVTLDYDKENNLYTISDEQMEALDEKVVDMTR